MTNDSAQKIIVHLILLILLSVIVYVNSLGNGFALDDLIHIKDNVHLTTDRPIWHYFMEPIFPWNLYRPLIQVSYQITYNFYQLDPLPYHLINILSHAGVTVLSFLLIKIIFNQQLAFITALLFAVLPIHTEAVANISGRYELWGALVSLLVLITASKKNWLIADYLLTGLLFMLALLCKESTIVTIPLLCLVLWYQNNFSRKNISERLLPLLVSLLLYFLLRYQALKEQFISSATTSFLDNPLIDLDFIARAFNAILLLGKYIYLSITAAPLSADYSFAELVTRKPFEDFGATIGAVIVILLFIVALIRLKKRQLEGFALLWFFISFAVTANILFPLGTIFGERLAYLPSLGICIILAKLISSLPQTINLLILATSVLYYGSVTINRNLVWRDDFSLSEAQILISPDSTKTNFNYAMMLRKSGDFTNSEKYLDKALTIYPDNLDALWGLGIIASDRGDAIASEKYLLSVLEKNPFHMRTLNSLTRLYLRQNNNELAEKFAIKLMNSWGGEFESKLTYLGLLIAKGDRDTANKLLSHLNSINPNHKELANVIQQGKKRGIF